MSYFDAIIAPFALNSPYFSQKSLFGSEIVF